uniref:Transmembrane protein n=1 Tax=Setaria viridis TaxID=4556 RepID=A0A4U6TD00_SETVI|nr:hypothetical protein SEVIR_9G573200v2 [Setaria viridis]
MSLRPGHRVNPDPLARPGSYNFTRCRIKSKTRCFASFALSFALSVTPSLWHHLFSRWPFPLPVCRLSHARCLSVYAFARCFNLLLLFLFHFPFFSKFTFVLLFFNFAP